MKKAIILFIVVINTAQWLQAQTFTNEELQKQYWNYRDRFRKFFIHIGIEDGKSIPFESLDKNFTVSPLNKDNNHPDIKGLINYGDACITHGWYMAVLATEYRLL